MLDLEYIFDGEDNNKIAGVVLHSNYEWFWLGKKWKKESDELKRVYEEANDIESHHMMSQ